MYFPFATGNENLPVSMKSGLEDRNNGPGIGHRGLQEDRLNEVRPGRPEQY